jgi:uncharacterized protein
MSERTKIRRLSERAVLEREAVDAILDEALICHVGFVRDDGPFVVPTIHARVGDTIYMHGSTAAGNLRAMKEGIDVCVTATIVDGIAAARSLFEHSMNYRSVVVFGRARVVDDPTERAIAFRAISDHVLPGRWDDARRPSRQEDRQTMVISVPIAEFSAKVRTGGVDDDEADHDLAVWAGVIPLSIVAGEPIPEPDLKPGIEVPGYIRQWRR